MSEWIANGLILLGLAVMTIGVYGVVRLPDVYTKLHASSKAAFLGVSGLLLAAALGGDPAIVARVILIIVVLAVTTPVAAHVVAQAAYSRREQMLSPGAVDESRTTPGARDTPAAAAGEEPVPDA
jgi:multicomponent Na+:H+ antiporter subunit G